MNKETEEIISGWGEEKDAFNSLDNSIDFSKAKPLKTTGSTCDAYETRYHGRRVFVKRLKEKFRFNDRYREAFRKEYEIGISLNHPSLPVYTDFYGDSLVMNFIDGKTLAELISSNDSRLQDKGFVLKMLKQLLDVLEYLHRKNIVHSDVKADNVMVTNSTDNVVLLDFDKCFTDALDMTPGSASLYGMPEGETGSPDIDYRGLGLIAGRLAGMVTGKKLQSVLKKFAEQCKKPEVSVSTLIKILTTAQAGSGERKPLGFISSWFIVMLGSMGLFVLVFLIGDYFVGSPEEKIRSQEEIKEEVALDSVTPVPVVEESGKEQINIQQNLGNRFPSEAEIDKELERIYSSLGERITAAEEVFNNQEIGNSEKFDILLDLSNEKSRATQEAYSYFESQYPYVNPVDLQMAVVRSRVFKRITVELTRISSILAHQAKEDADIDDSDIKEESPD